jgi:hypothetical protein
MKRILLFVVLCIGIHCINAYNAGSPYRNTGAFAALKKDTTINVWGSSALGGSMVGYDAADTQLKNGGFKTIYSTANNGFCAVKESGMAVWWGGASGGMPLFDPASSLAQSLSTGVTKVAATDDDYCALKSDGTLVTCTSCLAFALSTRLYSYIFSKNYLTFFYLYNV